jgi:hypothetical protein
VDARCCEALQLWQAAEDKALQLCTAAADCCTMLQLWTAAEDKTLQLSIAAADCCKASQLWTAQQQLRWVALGVSAVPAAAAGAHRKQCAGATGIV